MYEHNELHNLSEAVYMNRSLNHMMLPEAKCIYYNDLVVPKNFYMNE